MDVARKNYRATLKRVQCTVTTTSSRALSICRHHSTLTLLAINFWLNQFNRSMNVIALQAMIDFNRISLALARSCECTNPITYWWPKDVLIADQFLLISSYSLQAALSTGLLAAYHAHVRNPLRDIRFFFRCLLTEIAPYKRRY